MQSWEYTILVPESVDRSAAFARALAVAATLGWCARFPTCPFGPNGMELPAVASTEALIRSMGQDGGFVGLWQQEHDIGLSWCPDAHRTLGFIYSGNFHDQMTFEAEAFAQLFRALCVDIAPQYGFSSDDYLLFQFEPQPAVPWEAHLEAVRTGMAPQILLWLNYFSNAYFDARVAPSLVGSRHKVVEDANGVFLYLASAPWEAKVAELTETGYRIKDD